MRKVALNTFTTYYHYFFVPPPPIDTIYVAVDYSYTLSMQIATGRVDGCLCCQQRTDCLEKLARFGPGECRTMECATEGTGGARQRYFAPRVTSILLGMVLCVTNGRHNPNVRGF